MGTPTKLTIKRLFALSGNTCAFPRCNLAMVESSGTVTGEICHIEAQSKNGPRYNQTQSELLRHGDDNLVLLCRHHHKIIDSEPDLYDVESLREMKSIHEANYDQEEKAEDAFFASILLNKLNVKSIEVNNSNIAINSPGVIQAKHVEIKQINKKISILPPAGTVGNNADLSRYITYLINRYNKYASSDKSRRTKFSFGAISKNIESNFGSPWKLVHAQKVEELITYLHVRIKKTRIAKMNLSKGKRAYSTYQEFIQKNA